LGSFQSSTSLTELFINNNELSSLAPPKTDSGKKREISDIFPNLEILDAGNNKIADLEGVFALEKLAELVELVLVGNPVCSSPK
jgi:Leucine-rich repeat (LRR) protein